MFNGFCHFGNWGAWGSMGTWGWIGMILQLVFWVVLLVGIVSLVIWAARSIGRSAALPRVASGQPSAKEILQDRYARGEITREQYQQMLNDLS